MANTTKKNKKAPKVKKFYPWVWLLAFSPFFAFFACLGLASLGAFGELPSFEELENPKSNLASIVYSIEGKELGKYYVENRINTQYDEISENIVNALVSTEDERFYKHAGIDGIALLRAVGKGGKNGGGSTITQQLAKNLFHEEPKGKLDRVLQKFAEWVIALRLERNYTKPEIINMYLNKADFGHNIFGVSSATKIFFNVEPKDVTIPQGALLVGLLKAPTAYSPIKNPEKCKLRRNTVMLQMVKNNKLSREEYDRLKDVELIGDKDKLATRVKKNQFGMGELAPYFLAELKKDVEIWCEQNKNPTTGKPYNLYRDGLRIYTTIEYKVQQYAEQAVDEFMPSFQDKFFKSKVGKKNAPFSYDLKEKQIDDIVNTAWYQADGYKAMKNNGMSNVAIEKVFNTPREMTVFSWHGDVDTTMSPRDSIIYYKSFLQNGLMAMNPHTGHVKAWVGGIDFRYFKYDHVRAGKYDKDKKAILPAGGRQVGSTFKPFVYALAMQEGRSPCEMVPNVKVCIEHGVDKPWCPSNSGSYKDGEMVSLKDALANSLNYITALLMKQYGPHAVVNLTKKLGITAPIDPVPAICLGTADISVFEIVGAISTFFNKGIYTKPIFLLRIEDKNGNTLKEFATEQHEVMNEQSAYLTQELMKGVVMQGTAGRLRFKYKFTEPVAGKTGTTQNNSDGWFVGATPDLVAAVWTGADDRSVHFYSMADGQGASSALPVWAIFMRKVYDDKSIELNRGEFSKPSVPITTELNCSEYAKSVRDVSVNFDE